MAAKNIEKKGEERTKSLVSLTPVEKSFTDNRDHTDIPWKGSKGYFSRDVMTSYSPPGSEWISLTEGSECNF